MAKKYEVDGKYFLPVTVFTTDARSINPIGVQYVFASNGSKGTTYLDDYPDLLLTAEEIYASRRMVDEVEHLTDMLDYGRKKYDEIEELEARIAELEKKNGELKDDCNEWISSFDNKVVDIQTLTAERDNLKADLTTQKNVNDELKARIQELEVECEKWKATAQNCENSAKAADNAADNLRLENKKLMAGVDELKNTLVDRTKDVQHLTEENANLKAWYEEANKTASEAAEANDDLKAKIAELRDEVATLKAERCSLNGQVGKNLAEIQALSSDVHFFKEACKKQKAECDELKGRYDELDSVNKEQAEKIRKLDAERDTWERNAKAWKMTADGMSKRAEELQAENEKLNNRNKYLESEKNRKPIVHVLTNDGHVYAFTSSGKVSVKYHTELNILMIEDGEKTIAGFARGDKPGNLSAWWTG